MKEKVYKFVADNDTFIYVIANDIEIARNKILRNIKTETLKFKYCDTSETKVNSMKKALERGKKETWLSNTNSIVIC